MLFNKIEIVRKDYNDDKSYYLAIMRAKGLWLNKKDMRLTGI